MDGTAQGEKITHIREALEHIFNSELAHAVLVDCMRLFGSDAEFPTTGEIVKEVKEFTESSAAIEAVTNVMSVYFEE